MLRWHERVTIWEPTSRLFRCMGLDPYVPRLVIDNGRFLPVGRVRVVNYPDPYPDRSRKVVTVEEHDGRGAVTAAPSAETGVTAQRSDAASRRPRARTGDGEPPRNRWLRAGLRRRTDRRAGHLDAAANRAGDGRRRPVKARTNWAYSSRGLTWCDVCPGGPDGKVRSVGRWPGRGALVGVAPVIAIQLGAASRERRRRRTRELRAGVDVELVHVRPRQRRRDHDPGDRALGHVQDPRPRRRALLSLSALVYKSPVGGVPYTGTPTRVPVGTSLGHTGVCSSTHGSEPYRSPRASRSRSHPARTRSAPHGRSERSRSPSPSPRRSTRARTPRATRRRRFADHHRQADRPQRLERRCHQVRRDQR